MDMGIIAALKKCYKYLLIKDVLVFNDLSPSIQNQQQQQGAAIHRGAAGDHYGKSATILDAANYILEAWNSLTMDTITNCFVKADIIQNLDAHDEYAPAEGVDDNAASLQTSSISKQLDVETIEKEVDDVLNTDNEDSEEWQQCILDDMDATISSIENGLQIEDDIENDVDELPNNNGNGACVDFDTMLVTLGDFHNTILRHQGQLPGSDLQQCRDIYYSLEWKIQQIYSSLMAKCHH